MRDESFVLRSSFALRASFIAKQLNDNRMTIE